MDKVATHELLWFTRYGTWHKKIRQVYKAKHFTYVRLCGVVIMQTSFWGTARVRCPASTFFFSRFVLARENGLPYTDTAAGSRGSSPGLGGAGGLQAPLPTDKW